MKKYETNRYDNEITVFEVDKEIDHFIRVAGEKRLRAKENHYEKYHDTWEDAHRWLHESCLNEINRAKSRLSDLESDLRKVEALKLTRQMSPDQK